MRAIVYARVSTEEQAKHGYSLPHQIQECRRRAEELGANQIHEFVDHGISGEILGRPGLGGARDLLQRHPVAYFICTEPDRLARRLSHQLIVTEEIEQRGCKLVFIHFDWQNTPEGRLFYSLRGAISEYEREKIRERSMRGLRQKALQGGLTHDPQIYGYQYDAPANTLKPHPGEAGFVRQIYQWFIGQCLGYTQIATRLNQMGVPSKRGAQWRPTTIRRILGNSTYTGTLHLQKYQTMGVRGNRYRPPEERIKRGLRAEEDWIAIPVPPLIDESTFEAARDQALRVSRLFRAQRPRSIYLLSGLLRCGECGLNLSGTRSGERRYYRCNAGGACPLPYLPAGELEEAIWEQASSWLTSPQAQSLLPLTTEPQEDLRELLAGAQEEEERLLTLVQIGGLPPQSVATRIRDLQTRKASLQEAIMAQTVRPAQQIQIPPLDPKQRQTLLRMLIRGVVVSAQEARIESLVLVPTDGQSAPSPYSPLG